VLENEVNISGKTETEPNEAAATRLLDTTERLRTSLNQQMAGLRVGISISDSPDLRHLGFSIAHQRDAMIEFARFLLANGASLAYGGDLRQGGYTHLFFDLARHYGSDDNQQARIHNYESWPIYLKLTVEDRASLKRLVKFHPVTPPPGLVTDESVFLPPSSMQGRCVWARCLTKMRHEMNNATDARIMLGGPLRNYKGAIPGLLEEGALAILTGKPTYLIGAFGGATQALITAVSEPDSTQIQDLPASYDKEEQTFIVSYNALYPEEPIDFLALQQQLGAFGLEQLAKNNGLTVDENRRLFVTPHVMEMVYLVLTGLARVKILPKELSQ
jgi:hypothetical protein